MRGNGDKADAHTHTHTRPTRTTFGQSHFVSESNFVCVFNYNPQDETSCVRSFGCLFVYLSQSSSSPLLIMRALI